MTAPYSPEVRERLEAQRDNMQSFPHVLRDDLSAALAHIERLEGALGQAQAQFVFYAEQHLAKTPPDTAKAKTNLSVAERCERALSGADNDHSS